MAKTNKAKNINLTNLKKENKKLDSQTEHTLLIGETEYSFKVDDKFRKTKQHEVLNDLIEFFNASARNTRMLDVSTPYVTLLLIKHFTTIEISDDVDEALDMLNVLIDLELLDKIVNVMPLDETEKIYKLLMDTIDNMRRNQEDGELEAKELLEEIENQEVKDLLTNE